MNKSTIECIILAQGGAPIYRNVNERSVRVFVVKGQAMRSIGYLSTIEQMTEEVLICRINTAFARWPR